uniref:Uncharacterized protein n=1 Tax=Rhizobium rhizogenes TaxID=359 RepID=A0A7S5DQH6_RHIRH|nr:hypothetical protein pC6.5b_254 [Rhizobium rhizogenes]
MDLKTTKPDGRSSVAGAPTPGGVGSLPRQGLDITDCKIYIPTYRKI